MLKFKKLNLIFLLASIFTIACYVANIMPTFYATAKSLPTSDEVNNYLLDNGYSEFFIKNTGEQTKLHLYNQNAKFISTSVIPSYNPTSYTLTSNIWSGLSHQLTISDITEDSSQPQFILTYHFSWNTELALNNDCFTVSWSHGFAGITNSAVYELYGNGILTDSYTPSIYVPLPESCGTYTFLHKTGDAAMTSHFINNGIGKKLNLEQCTTLKMYYASGTYGIYSLNPESFNGNFSITIAQRNISSGIGTAVASFYHWEEDVEYEFQVVLGTETTIGVTASDNSHYEKSPDTSDNFYF